MKYGGGSDDESDDKYLKVKDALISHIELKRAEEREKQESSVEKKKTSRYWIENVFRFNYFSVRSKIDEDDIEADSDLLKELEIKRKKREEEERKEREEQERWEEEKRQREEERRKKREKFMSKEDRAEADKEQEL